MQLITAGCITRRRKQRRQQALLDQDWSVWSSQKIPNVVKDSLEEGYVIEIKRE